MSSQTGSRPDGVKRIVYKQIVFGDFRKFLAKSNDATSGGGARDLRFRPYEEFVEIFRLMFPHSRVEMRRRNDRMQQVEVLVGKFHWTENGGVVSKEATFETPTTAREGEGRIPTVYKYGPFNRIVEQWPEDKWGDDKRSLKVEGRLVLLLVQREDGSVWPEFATEKSLGSGAWAKSVSTPILNSLAGERRISEVARGYIDFEHGRGYSDDD